jgi:hypothetical protein
MDMQEETSGTTGMQQWNKGPRLKMAAASEDGEGNWQQHQGIKQETENMSGKKGDMRPTDKLTSWSLQSKQPGLPLDCRK